jgi:hypothetical protein
MFSSIEENRFAFRTYRTILCCHEKLCFVSRPRSLANFYEYLKAESQNKCVLIKKTQYFTPCLKGLQKNLEDKKHKMSCFFNRFVFFPFDLEQSFLGSDLVLKHPSGVSTLYFQVATFQKRAHLAEPPRRTSDP